MSNTTCQPAPYIHPSSLCDGAAIGTGTKVWPFTQVMPGAMVGTDCNIGSHTFIESGVSIGHRVTIKNGVMIYEGVTIEDEVFIGPAVVFTNDRYPRSPRTPAVQQRYANKGLWLEPTRVGRGASIGASVTILCGVTIGRFATIAAGSVVTKDVPAFALMRGAPAVQVGWVCPCGNTVDRTTQVTDTMQCNSCKDKELRNRKQVLVHE